MAKNKITKPLVYPKGVSQHGNSLRITFYYKGDRCRESVFKIPENKDVTQNNIDYANGVRHAVLNEINHGSFVYSKRFPDSLKAKTFEGISSKGRAVEEGVDLWLQKQKSLKASSTYRGYASKSKHIKNRWPKTKIADITKTEIEQFRLELIGNPKKRRDSFTIPLNTKTVNDIFTVLRGVFEDAFYDEIITLNPMLKIKNIEVERESLADPFTEEEIIKISSHKTNRIQEQNMAMFGMYTGLSISEIIALAWEDVDLEKGIVRVCRGRVEGEFKSTKEAVRIRNVELIPAAKDWLNRQKKYTFDMKKKEITVKQRDNINFKTEKVRIVFLNSNSKKPHTSDKSVRECFWREHLTKAGVRYRGSGQWRHTFASQMLSKYIPQEWIARQLGHSDTTMLRRHYGKWIPSDTKPMIDLIAKLLKNDEKLDHKSIDQ